MREDMGKPKPKPTVADKNGSSESSRMTSSEPSEYPRWWIALVVVTAIAVSYINSMHLNTLFENDKHFSHLADFEREMAYRTEMGLYFSYYKTIINAPSFIEGVGLITKDNVTEYGHTINTLKRFNLYPEVFLAFAYRQFKWAINTFNWKMEICWQVNRGEALQPVQSCEGIGNSHYFYNYAAFAIAGTVAGSLFLLGVLISDSFFGGLISVLCFFYNHGEATRVQWTPPLRESFAFPLIIAQITVVTYILKNHRSCYLYSIPMIFLSVNAMLFWQFSQFAFFTQIGSIAVVYAMDFIPFETLKVLLIGHLTSFLISFVMLFGNEMLLTSLYFPSILSLACLTIADKFLTKISVRSLYALFSLGLFIGITLAGKIFLSTVLQIKDDAHIFDILRSKFSNYANFHTRLYTCSAEFDFMPMETIWKLIDTLLIPSAVASVVIFILYLIVTERHELIWRENNKFRPHSEIFYNVVQLICYTFMAVIIMRLKLFFTPHLCVLAALVASSKLLDRIGLRMDRKLHIGLIVVLIAVMTMKGKINIEKQLAIRGEYSNPEQEELFEWIMKKTKPTSVFAGTMPVMANVKLSTGRPIVNHPHYEDVGIRERTLRVYSMFSKKPINQVHSDLKSMGIKYFVFQLFNCGGHQIPQCSYRGMWDESDPSNRGRTSLCDLYHAAAVQGQHNLIEPFKVVFNPRNNYVVLKL